MRNAIRPRRDSHGGFGLRGLTRDEYEDIHAASMEIMRDVGVVCTHEKAREVFHAHGATIEGDYIKVPAWLVEECVQAAPAEFILHGRIPKHNFVMGGNRIGFNSFGTGTKVVDIDTGKVRPSTQKDLADIIRLIDALDEIDFANSTVAATELPSESYTLHMFETIALNTTKPFRAPAYSKFAIDKAAGLMAIILGGEDKVKQSYCYPSTCPVSPLRFIDECVEITEATVSHGMPLCILSMVMTGGTSPMHLASTIAIHNAEILFGITFAQLLKKGTPVIYGSSSASMDLRFGAIALGTPETALLSGAITGMAQFYKLPCRIAGG